MNLNDTNIRHAIAYAKAQTAFHSKSFYLSTQFLPKEKRLPTFALYSFCRYADNIVDNPRNRTVDELTAEIEYLKYELAVAYRSGESEHPILKAFIPSALAYNIPLRYPLELLDGVKLDLLKNRYQSFAELYQFAYAVAGVVGIMMSYIIGFSDPAALNYAEKLGVAMQLANILRDIQEDKNMNRIYLPLDEVRQFGLDEKDFFKETFNDAMRQLVKYQVERAHRFFIEADNGIPMLSRDGRFAVKAASRIYRGILSEIEKRDYNPFLGRVFVPQSRKFAILLQEFLRTNLFQRRQTSPVFPQPVTGGAKHS